ncbi:TVP38/TMEM64 family protein [Cohnella sp.]|uniref:TVP38/TMEM64 family protein n=1 Tax=Cohnella sp. TaxID=1883426 RepID=UPI00356A9FC6
MLKKLSLAILYMGIASLIYLYGEDILDWFHQSDNIALIALMAVLMALFPVIPYPFVGGVLGAAFGPVLGGVITWVGSTAASILMFLFVRYGYQEWGSRVLYRYNSLGKITELFERNAFLTIIFARLIPFVPSFIINIYAALSRVSFGAYALSSALGKVPAMLLFALVGDSLVREPRNMMITIGIYVVFISMTLVSLKRIKRRIAVQSLQRKI